MAVPINQGTINRLRTNLTFVNHPELNITPGMLGKGMIKLLPQGEITKTIPTATGFVTSPEPYQIFEIEIHLLRTTALAAAFYNQWKNLSTLGDATSRSDSTVFPDTKLFNTCIKSVGEIDQSGENPDFTVHMIGYELINSSLYNV